MVDENNTKLKSVLSGCNRVLIRYSLNDFTMQKKMPRLMKHLFV